MTQTEALTLALEALKDNQHLIADNERHAYVMEYNSIIEKCEKALAQQSNEQVEPVAYGTWDTMLGKGNRMMMVRLDKGQDGCTVPLYTTPPQPKEPEQEPDVYIPSDALRQLKGTSLLILRSVPLYGYRGDGLIPLYTTPPQRKPLTDEQREVIAKGWRGRNWTLGDVIDAVEAAHGIKE